MDAQSASAQGSNNTIIQAQGDHIHIEANLAHLELIPVQARLRGRPRRDIEILNPEYQAVPLEGREGDLKTLHAWLAAEPKIAIAALIGPAGSGKTRLALHLLQELPKSWLSGFLTPEEARRFVDAKNLRTWGWQQPTLIVADYAALQGETLAKWFGELADHAQPGHPLRILLLERHADAASGWYRNLTDGTWHGQAVRQLFDPAEPMRITPLSLAGQRRAVFAAGLNMAAALAPNLRPVSLPPPGADAWLDQQLAAEQWSNPLLLLMAAVIASTEGLPAALNLNKPDLARRLAGRECDRLRNTVESHAAKHLLAHLYACVTLCRGLARRQAVEVAETEFAALHKQYPEGAGQAVDDLAAYLGANAGLPSPTPDLLAEALLLVALGENGVETVRRQALVAPRQMAERVIQTVQDFAPFDEPLPLEWAEALVKAGEADLAVLFAIHKALPLQLLALRPMAVRVALRLVDALRSAREAGGESGQSMLASALNNLSVRLGEMGQREAALKSIAEAVGIRRNLASSNPEAFRPDLARSVSVRGGRLEEAERLAEARDAAKEALQLLAPFFTRYPGAHDGLARATVADYLRRCERLSEEPEPEVLEPYLRLTEKGDSNAGTE